MSQQTQRIERFTRDGLTFAVDDGGPLDGEPVVLLHGFPERKESWREVAALLQAQGHRTLALDQRGYCETARPRGRRAYKAGELVRDVLALVDEVSGPGGSAHVVGHDWGAMVAWATAIAAPERTRSLTAFSVPHPSAFSRALLGRQALKSWYMLLFNVPWLVETLADRRPKFFLDQMRGSGMTAEEVETCKREVIDTGALKGGLMYYRAIPLAGKAFFGAGPSTVPTTYVWSDADIALGREGAERCADHCTGPYEYVELAGVSHWIPTQEPEAAAAAINARVASVAAPQ